MVPKIITKMAGSGNLEIVERALLQAALKEIELGESGIVDEQTAVELGRAVGANAILLGSFVSIGETIRINARLIDVKTSKIIEAESVQGSANSEIFQLMDQLASTIESQLRGDTETVIQYQQIAMVTEEKEDATIDKPFYKKWWFWTITGVGIAGGAAIIMAAEEEDKYSTVNLTINIPD